MPLRVANHAVRSLRLLTSLKDGGGKRRKVGKVYYELAVEDRERYARGKPVELSAFSTETTTLPRACPSSR